MVLFLILGLATARADFGTEDFDGRAAAPDGSLFTQAGGDPYSLTTEVEFSRVTRSFPFGDFPFPDEPVKDVRVDLPPGLLGNPSALGTCEIGELSYPDTGLGPLCPAGSQVGTAHIELPLGVQQTVPIYNMTPPPGVIARLGFNVLHVVVTANAELRSGADNGVSVNFTNISEGTALLGSRLTLWGDPAASAHLPERACPGQTPPTQGGSETCSTGAESNAFLRLPTSCGQNSDEGLQWSLSTDSWDHPGDYATASFRTHEAPGLADELPPSEWGPQKGTTGCDAVPFEPTITAAPTTAAADSPTGLDVDLAMLQSADPEAIATSDLKDAVVTLPQGMSINPAQANGLAACSAAQIGLLGTAFPDPAPIHFTPDPAQCPDSSKIGIVEIHTPLLDHPLDGSVYLAAQQDNPFKSLLAIYLTVNDPQTGIVLKLAGHLEAGPDGRLTTTFENQPQTPFDHLHLELFGGSNAPLINPPSCGTYSTEASLTPWARPDEELPLSSSFEVTQGPNGQPCPSSPLGFDPKLSAGSASPLAGAFTPFNLRLTREDATQRLSGLSLTPPPGLLASLRGIAYCPEATLAQISSAEGTGAAQIADPSCPASSQVGTVTAGAGAGPNPFYTEAGKAYLAGPYKGAPLSLAVVAPAVAGPFDLGNVVVRNALHIDPETAKITAVSDPIPTIIHGIPLDLRDLRVNLDRPNFTLNPTSCDPLSVNATVSGDEGASADLSDHFQVGECGALAFKPKLTLRLKGKTRRTGHPALRATLTMPQKGPNADIAKAAVTLPHSEFLAQAHIRTICTRVQYAAGGGGGEQCPKGSVYGHARAFTPLLDQPLEGPVYLRSSNHPLPDLVASLGGQIHIDLVGRIDAPNGGIRNTFEAVPDAPVSKFVLTMQGGGKGLLENSTDLCKGTHRATARFDGQNGKLHDLRPRVRADCGRGRKHKHRRPHRRTRG
jgi:hypothetical protein